MKITFLGTNGWYDTPAGVTPCILVQTGTEHIVLDAGNGIYKLDRYITDDKPIYLFISHYHFDHINGIHTFNRFDFKQGVTVFGPEKIKDALGGLMKRPYTKPLRDLPTRFRLEDLRPGRKLPVAVEFRKLNHPVLCYGFRFTLEGKVLAYCTDTGPCDNILRLAKGADLLISECSFKSGQTSSWGHLNPELAAAQAKEAGAGKLMLTHFDAALYLTRQERMASGRIAKTIFKNTTVAFDDLQVTL